MFISENSDGSLIRFTLIVLSICVEFTEIDSNDIECGLSKTIALPQTNCKNNRMKFSEDMNNMNIRIVNGMKANIEELPWMSSIIVKNGGYCGAVIIEKFWLLSAAHCLYPNVAPNMISVRIGSNDKLRGLEFRVKNLIIHPKYIETQRIIYDIALIELMSEIKINISNANRACIPSSDLLDNRPELTVFSGWGQTGISGDRPTNTLMKAFYYTIPHNQCKYKTKYFICVNESQRMGCAGDSGSPLVQNNECKAIVIGVFSMAERYDSSIRCGPALLVFVRISHHIDWIQSLIKTKPTFEENLNTPENPRPVYSITSTKSSFSSTITTNRSDVQLNDYSFYTYIIYFCFKFLFNFRQIFFQL